MFFKPRPKNRRFERDQILEVKLRSSQRRQARWRRLTLAFGIFLVVFSGLFLLWRGGEWMLRRLVYENPAFAIHQLDVQTDGAIALEQLRSWAGVKLEDNLFALDLARVQRDLELVSVIQRASVERVFPHTLRLRVMERTPIAQFILPPLQGGGSRGHGVYTFDAEGYVMWPLENHQRATVGAPTDSHLPVLAGLPFSELRVGRQVRSEQVHAALRLIEAFDRSSMAAVADLRRIDLTSPNILQVTTGQGGAITFGLNDLDGQLRRWRCVFDFGQRNGKQVASLDLSVANNLPARWLEASLLPPASPKPNPAQPHRKKNV